jgi:cytidylate kinase
MIGRDETRSQRGGAPMKKLVALSASYGSGGNVVGQALAERLGVPFVDRAIPVKVAEETQVPADALTSDAFRRATERVLLGQCGTGEGVILGRAAAIVLHDDPRVLKVRLDGPRDARIPRAMALFEVAEPTATRTLERLDRIHADYASELYGADIHDFALYDLIIDSTRIPAETCVEMISAAAHAEDHAAAARGQRN